MVRDFHTAFKLDVGTEFGNVPPEIAALRHNLLAEENGEYLDACKENNEVEIADAIGDMLYIVLGTALAHGFQDKIESVFEEIQRSNMSKLGEDGKPIYREDGKVLKGPNYFQPKIEEILNQ